MQSRNKIKEKVKWLKWFLLLFPIYSIVYFKKSISGSNRRIIIFPSNMIGDFIMQTPIFREIKEALPKCHLSVFLTTNKFADLIKNNKYIDEIIKWNINDDLLLKLKKLVDIIFRNYSFAILYRPESWVDLLSLFFFVPYRFSILSKSSDGISQAIRKIISNNIIYYRKGEYAPDVYLKPLKFFEDLKYNNKLELQISNSSKTFIENLFKEHNINSNKNNIGIAPASSKSIKMWEPQKFAQLINLLDNEFGNIFIIGGQNDRELINNILNGVTGDYVNLCGQLTLIQLAALCKKLDLFIGLDSGPTYIAQAVDCNTLTIIGPTDYKEVIIPSQTNKIIRSTVECHPCSYVTEARTKCKRGAKKCLHLISIEDVYSQTQSILSQ